MKGLFLLLLTGFSLIDARAQVQIGIKGGVNFSTITGEYYGQAKTITGFNLGALISFPLFSKFTLQPELLYSGEGARTTQEGVSADLLNNYMHVPILFKYNNPTGIFIETGPQVGYLLNAKLKFYNFTEDEKPNDTNTEFSWVFGLGYLFKDLHMGIDARYTKGISNFIYQTYIGSGTNNVMQVGIFFIFGVKPPPDYHK